MTNSNINYNIIEINQERCIGCSSCLRVCPSPEANSLKVLEDGRTVTEINSSKCIACGECIKACRAKARDYEDDIDRFFKDIRERKIIIIAHPAIKTAFPGTWQAVLKWFNQNGAAGIYDGAYGADICTWAYVRAIEQGNAKNVLSQHCPAVVRYMELYHPNEVRELSPVHSPTSCEAIYIRDFLKKNYAVAVLSPCPAMKLEFQSTGHAEYNITFKRLKEYFRRKKIDFNKAIEGDMHYDFDDQVQGCMGGIFPNPGGLKYNLTINMQSVSAISSDGAATVYKELDTYASLPPHRHPQVFEVLSCSGGCGCGCGVHSGDEDQTSIEIKTIMRDVELDAKNRRKVAMNGTDKMFKEFDNKINPKSLMRNYNMGEKLTPQPSEKELSDIYQQMGKNEGFDRHIDCGACGYRTCEELAKAVAAGRNSVSSCVRCGGSSNSSAASSNKRTAEMAQQVSDFATNLLADIENIYASLYNIDSANQQSASMSKIVVDILSKIVGFCSSTDSIDADNLPLLISTLEKLQTAVSSLNNNVSECASDSSTIREAMQEVADATTKLNVMANDMVSTLSN